MMMLITIIIIIIQDLGFKVTLVTSVEINLLQILPLCRVNLFHYCQKIPFFFLKFI